MSVNRGVSNSRCSYPLLARIRKITELKEALNQQSLNPGDIPGVYCATGTATSTDIKVEQDCVCGKCVIFPEYRLFNYEPMCHYCISGSAK